jgi:hypothetical protein
MKGAALACVVSLAALSAPCVALSPGENQEASKRLRQVIDERYSHRDRVVKDWDARFTAAGPRMAGARSADEFATQVAELLGAAGDPHLNVLVGGRLTPTFQRRVERNGDPKRLPKLLASLKQESNSVVTGRTREGFGYILIAQWPAPDSPLMAPVHAAIDALIAEKVPALILDVRVNAGGNDLSALRVAERFASQPVEYCRTRTREPQQPGGWTPWYPRALKPVPESPRYGGRVAALCGPACMSSCETFLLMMRAAGARLVGARTYGSSGNPKPHDLGNGVTVMVPSWEEADAKGQPIEGRGIEPDIQAEPGMAPGDDVLAAAVAALRP